MQIREAREQRPLHGPRARADPQGRTEFASFRELLAYVETQDKTKKTGDDNAAHSPVQQ